MFLSLVNFTALKDVKISFFCVIWEKQLMILAFFSSDSKFPLGIEHLSGSVLIMFSIIDLQLLLYVCFLPCEFMVLLN